MPAMLTSPVDEARAERARRAVGIFRRMVPQLSGFAAVITGIDTVRVELTSQGPHTDGRIIYLRPPIELGDEATHDLRLCAAGRTPVGPVCPACLQRENVMMGLYHEIAHIAFESFAPVTDADKLEAIDRAIREREADDARAALIRARIEGAHPIETSSYKGLSSLVSPHLPNLVNAIEDFRVNRELMRARPGTREAFTARYRRVFSEGIDNGDVERDLWHNAPANAQAVVGIFAALSGLDYSEYFAPEVVAMLDDDEVQAQIEVCRTVETAADVYTASFGVLEAMRAHGFCKRADDPEPEPEPPPVFEKDDEPRPENGDGSDEDSKPNPDREEQPEKGDTPDVDDSTDDGEPDDGGEDAGSESPDGDTADADDESGDGEPGAEDGSTDDPSDDDSTGESDGDASDDDEGDGEGAGDSDDADDDEQGDGEGASVTGTGSDGPDGAPGAVDGDDTPEPGEPGGEPSSTPDGDGDDTPEPDGEPNGEHVHGDHGPTCDCQDCDDDTELEGDDDDDDAEGEPAPAGTDPGESRLPEEHVEAEEQPEPYVADGEPEDVEKALDNFLHGDHQPEGEGTPPTPEQRAADENEVDRAIAGEAFDSGSATVFGVRHHHFDKPYIGVDGVDHSFTGYYGAWSTRGLYGAEGDASSRPSEALLGPALMQMRAVFADNAKWKRETGLRSGKVNGRTLGRRVTVGDDRLFHKRDRPGKKDYHVVIGLDISGSTRGGAIVTIKAAAFAQAELLRRAGISFEMYAHTGSYHDQTITSPGGPMLALDVYHIKDTHEAWDAKTQQRLDRIHGSAANLDGHTLEFYRKRLDASTATDKIIMYYTDGAMPAENYEEELAILQREIAVCKRKGYTLMAVGVGNDDPVRYGLDTCRIDRVDEVRNVVKHLEKRLVN